MTSFPLFYYISNNSMANCTNPPSCLVNLASSCVFYNGELLTTLNILNGDTVSTALTKIDTFLATFSGGGGAETANSKTDSSTVAITLTGTASRNIKADAKISSTANNKLSVVGTGLFAAPATSSLSFNATTGLLSVTVDGTTSSVTVNPGNYTETVYGS